MKGAFMVWHVDPSLSNPLRCLDFQPYFGLSYVTFLVARALHKPKVDV